MQLILLLCMALPQDYVNMIMDGKFEEAISYCEEMIEKGRDVYKWKLEMGDIHLDKLQNFSEAIEIYRDLIENYKKKDGWLYYRLALALEMNEDYLNAAKSYELVATQFRKSPLDSFALSGVERCFKKNYQDFVAKIDGHTITRLELDEEIAKRSPFAKRDEKAVLDQMIIQTLIYVKAAERGVRGNDSYKEGIVEKRKSLLLEEITAVDIVKKASPTKSQMKRYYRRNKENFVIREQVRGKEIVVDSDSLASFILDSLRKSIESFDTLAKVYSTSHSGKTGGNMGVVFKGVRPKPVDEALFKAKLNELIGAISFDEKFGIYLVTEHKEKSYRSFDEVKSQIDATLKAEKIKKVEQDFVKKLKRKAKIRIYEEKLGVSDTAQAATEDQVVAVLNGREILETAVEKRNEVQPQFGRVDLTQPEEFRKLLNQIIEEELKLAWAETERYYLNDGYVVKIKDATRRLMENELYKEVVVEGASVDTDEVKNYYKEHKEEFKIPETVRCQEIVVKSSDLAKELHAVLRQHPEMFDSLAREHSTKPTAQRGGDTGAIRRGMRSKEFEGIVFKLKVGSISKIFSEDDSTYTIIKLVEHNPTTYRTFEEIKSSIETNLIREKRREIATAYLDKIKQEADIEILLTEPEELEQKENIEEKETQESHKPEK